MKIKLSETVTLDTIKTSLPQTQIDKIKPTNALILNTNDGNNYIVFVDENDNIMGFTIEADEVTDKCEKPTPLSVGWIAQNKCVCRY